MKLFKEKIKPPPLHSFSTSCGGRVGREGRATKKNHCGILRANTPKLWSPGTLGFLSPSYLRPHKVTARGKPMSSHKMLTWYHEEQGPQKHSPPSHAANVFSSPFKAPATATILLWDAELGGLSFAFFHIPGLWAKSHPR